MRIHRHDASLALAVLEYADCENAWECGVPGFGAGDLRRLGEPEGAVGAETPDGRAVEKGGIFTGADAIISSNSHRSPFGLVRGVGVGGLRMGGGVEAREDVEELGVKDFLKADDGGGYVRSVEMQFGD